MACSQAALSRTGYFLPDRLRFAKGHVSICHRVICYGAELMFGAMLALARASRLVRLRAQGRGLPAN